MNLTHSEQINEVASALAKAQGAMAPAMKDANNPFFHSKYADLASVWDACRKPLTSNGLSIVQSPSAEGTTVKLDTILLHTSGQWMCGTASAVAKDDGPQAIGSAITYLRRYALQSFAGVAPEDDDAEAGEGRTTGTQASAVPRKPIQQPARTTSADGGLRVTNAKVAKEGKSAKGPWTLYAVKFSDGREATTFSKSIYEAAVEAFQREINVDATIDGKNLVELAPVFQQDTELQPADYDEGAPF